jgi:hypothetical protein
VTCGEECKISIMSIQEREREGVRILVTHFFNVEEAATHTDVSFTDILDAIDDCCSDSPGNTIIVRLSNSSNSRDVSLDKVMLRKIYRERGFYC